MKRIGVCQIMQETNGFNPLLTRREDFESFGVGMGAEVVSRFGEVDELSGFSEGLNAWSEPCTAVGIVRAQAWSGGPLASDTLAWVRQALCRGLAEAGPLDGLLLALHGALAAEDQPDVDGLVLEEARRALGPDIPIVATVDLHAHCTSRMLRASDAVVAYHTAPHLDRRQTGARGAVVLERILSGARPTTAQVRLPMISIAEVHMTDSPLLAPVFRRLRDLESQSDMMSAAVLMTQPWLDVAELGWSTLVTTDGKPELARRLAEELAEMCWSRREEMTAELHSADECISLALACQGKPVVIADGGDATNSGAGGDSTHLLKAMLGRGIPGGALTIMVDPQGVARAKRVGAGGIFRCSVGGKRDSRFSRPLGVRGTVVSLQAASYMLSGHGGENLPIDMGLSATVQIGDVSLLLVERPGPGSTPDMYRCAGLEPRDFKIVVVKSPAGFRAEFGAFAAAILLADCPGCASPRFETLPYRHISRPLWPLDAISDWRTVSWVN